MWKAALVVAGLLFILGAVLKGWTVIRRRRALAVLDPAGVLRLQRDVTITALLYGVPAMMGLDPRRRNRTRGDLAMTESRFLIASARGVLADIQRDGGSHMTSARCTGPMRLVLEGDIALPDRVGRFRYDLVIPDAEGWAAALRPFVRHTEDSRRFAEAATFPRAAGEQGA